MSERLRRENPTVYECPVCGSEGLTASARFISELAQPDWPG